MSKLEVLCVSMHQSDFSIVEKLNLKSDAVIANQCDRTSLETVSYDFGTVKMISTQTLGVGKNRNIALIYATGDILLLSDDDMCYSDTYAEDILLAFEKQPKADVIIFNVLSNDNKRKQFENKRTKKTGKFSRMPYGAPRIAFRKEAWEKSNIWFTTLFGGGAKYTNGEDSIFLNSLRKKGLTVYVSNIFIGTIDMSTSSWYKGFDEEFFFNKGAYLKAMELKTSFILKYYYAFRLKSSLTIKERLRWLGRGEKAYRKKMSYQEYIKGLKNYVMQ